MLGNISRAFISRLVGKMKDLVRWTKFIDFKT